MSTLAGAMALSHLTDLSNGALITLSALLMTSDGNGHDFGFMDEALAVLKPQGMTRHQFAGYVSALGDLIEWTEDLDADRAQPEQTGIQFALVDWVTEAAQDIWAHTEGLTFDPFTVAEVVATSFDAATAVVITAKTAEGNVWTDAYRTAAEAIQAGIDLRKAGTVNWRTIRYTIAGESVTTPALRKMASK